MALAGVGFITDYWLPLRRGEETVSQRADYSDDGRI